MGGVSTWILIFMAQLVLVVVVLLFLRKKLEEEFLRAAYEHLQGNSSSEFLANAEQVLVIAAVVLPVEWRDRLRLLFTQRCPRARVEFRENAALRGGLVVEISGEVMDFSLAGRLGCLAQ